MAVRAIRGATTVPENDRDGILSATREMLVEMVSENDLKREDIISIVFTVTRDLDAVFPAVAARELGFTDVPLLDMAAPAINDSLEKCIRAMIHINSEKENTDMRHVYLHGAKGLRPDLVKGEKI